MECENKKIAVVSGGAGSIGTQIVKRLAKEGIHVYFIDLNREEGEGLEQLVLDSGGYARFFCGSTSEEAMVCGMVKQILEQEGKIDILVNNVGYNVGQEHRKPICDFEEEWWDKCIDICLDGMYFFCKYIVPQMKRRKSGKIVNIGSVTGFRAPLRFQAAYNAAKAAIHAATRTMALDWGVYGIHVNCVIPGSIMNRQLMKILYQDSASMSAMTKHIPLGKPGIPEDIANAVNFLCSGQADYITGLLMNVDGGWAAGYHVYDGKQADRENQT